MLILLFIHDSKTNNHYFRWPEGFLCLLMRNGYTIYIPENWDGNEATLLVEGKELWEYVNEDMSESKHQTVTINEDNHDTMVYKRFPLMPGSSGV